MSGEVLFFPDGNASAIPVDVQLSEETVTAAIRVCARFGAVDVLPMLGVTA
jgi:hypothetical protein